jgi:hypothetical protein
MSRTELASAWLEALRRRDASGLAAVTQYPFDLRDTGTAGRAGSREAHSSATSERDMPAAVQSLITDDVLDRAMQAETYGRIEELEGGQVSGWAARWEGSIPADVQAFTAFFRSNEAAFSFIFLVGDAGVRSVWKTGFDAAAEVSLAAQWLQALRDRDTPALERLTSYPFELRDSQLEAHCGSRTASGRAELSATLDCLLDDPLFSEALKTRGAFKPYAGSTRDFVPGFFEGWRRPEHAELWPTSVLISTGGGHEYDLCLLVAKNGVQVLWKRGSFSPPD